jgi:hypothetical protein
MVSRIPSVVFHVVPNELISLAVDDLASLSDRHVDARPTFSIGEPYRLRHSIWLIAAMLECFEGKAGPVEVRVLRSLLRRQRVKVMN